MRDLSEYLDKIDAAEAENLESVYLYDKAYDEGVADGYKQAVDEFAEKLILRLEHEKKGQEYLKFNVGDYTSQVNIHKYAICCYELVIYIVNGLADQMKKGGVE